MSRKPPNIAPEDAALFRAAIGEVRQSTPVVAPPRSAPPKPVPRMRAMDEADAVAASHRPDPQIAQMLADGVLAFRRPHVPARVLNRLRQGHYAAQDEVDLHGLSESRARALLIEFLAHASRAGWRCLRVVHGKGTSSPGGASVLRPLVAHLLSQRGDVLAFASAPAAQGGTGATLVLLGERHERAQG